MVQTTDDALLVQVNRREVPLHEMPVASLLAGLPMTGLADSTLDGCVRFKASPSLAERDPRTAAIIATTGALRGPDGVYSIKIEGRVGQRKLLGQACG